MTDWRPRVSRPSTRSCSTSSTGPWRRHRPRRPPTSARMRSRSMRRERSWAMPPTDPAASPDLASVTGLVIPWWRRLLADDAVLVVAVDDPEAASWRAALAAEIEPEQALAAWLAWHRHLAAGAAGLAVVAVDPDAVATAAGRAALAGVLEQLGVSIVAADSDRRGDRCAGWRCRGGTGTGCRTRPDPRRPGRPGPRPGRSLATRAGGAPCPVPPQGPGRRALGVRGARHRSPAA